MTQTWEQGRDNPTLTWVSDVGDRPDNYGNLYVNVKFDNGVVAYKAAKEADIYPIHAELVALLDQASSKFEWEDTGKLTKNGAPKMKLVAWPGHDKPLPYDGPSSPSDAPRRTQTKTFTPRDETLIQERMDRRTALMQAVEVWKANPKGEFSFGLAGEMYLWLRKPMNPEEPRVTASSSVPEGGEENKGKGSEPPNGLITDETLELILDKYGPSASVALLRVHNLGYEVTELLALTEAQGQELLT